MLLERRGATAWLTLNRPAKLNVLSSELIAEATRALASLGGEDGPKVTVLRGAGRAFVAGADVREMRGFGPAEARDFITHLHGLFSMIATLDGLVVASIHGPALGAGCELVAVCDLRIAATSATFGMPEVRVGMPSVIEAALLMPLIGLGRAQDLVYTGDVWSAAAAQSAGLINRVVPDEDLHAATEALVHQLAGYSGRVLQNQKALVRRWYHTETYDRSVKLGIDHFEDAFRSTDPAAAIDAFLERRELRFDELGR